MLILDLLLIILIYMLVFMILSGFYSLIERKMLAAFQLRIGPGLFLAGVLTPITDGVKLLFKNAILIINVDTLYLCICCTCVFISMYISIFIYPIGYIIIIDLSLSFFIIISLHLILNIFGVYAVGCYLYSSCYIYLATMRSLYFSILGEGCVLCIFYCNSMLEYFSFFSIKDITICQLFISNFFILGILFFCITCVIVLLDGLRLPFDYLECESELVAGLITEFSGIFFILYSLMEINHILLGSIMFICILFGGYYICFKSLFVITIVYLIPRSIGFRLKVTNTHCLLINYIYILLLTLLTNLVLIKFLIILII